MAVECGKPLLTLLLLAGAGCATPSVPHVVRNELIPNALATEWQTRTRETSAPCADPLPLSPAPTPSTDRVRAGYESWASPNASACLKAAGFLYRGAVGFVIPPDIRRVKTAQLEFQRVLGSSLCAVSAYPATSAWEPGYQEGFLQGPRDPKYRAGNLERGASSSSTDVTLVVNEWLNHARLNQGFVVVGENETYPEKNEQCVADITGFRLILTHEVPQETKQKKK